MDIEDLPYLASLPLPHIARGPSLPFSHAHGNRKQKSYDYSLIAPLNPGTWDFEAENICGDGLVLISMAFAFMLKMEAERSVVSTTRCAYPLPCPNDRASHRSIASHFAASRLRVFGQMPRIEHSGAASVFSAAKQAPRQRNPPTIPVPYSTCHGLGIPPASARNMPSVLAAFSSTPAVHRGISAASAPFSPYWFSLGKPGKPGKTR